jgi:membrane-associated PAP2 superfamily phosphatase
MSVLLNADPRLIALPRSVYLLLILSENLQQLLFAIIHWYRSNGAGYKESPYKHVGNEGVEVGHYQLLTTSASSLVADLSSNGSYRATDLVIRCREQRLYSRSRAYIFQMLNLVSSLFYSSSISVVVSDRF